MHRFGNNAALVKSPPPGDFAYVSSTNTDWSTRLLSLISQKRPVNYDFFPLHKFPDDVLEKVAQNGYQHLILEKDHWQHFFIPPAGEFKHAAPDGMTSTGGVS